MTYDLERIAQTIAEEYPAEPEPQELARDLAWVAEALGIAETALIAWIRDRPRHERTARHLERWSRSTKRYS